MTTTINSLYTIGASRHLVFRDQQAFILDQSIPGRTPYLVNEGSLKVILTADLNNRAAVDTTDYGSGKGVWNKAGATITMSATSANILGFRLSGGEFHNDGTVQVSSDVGAASLVHNVGAMDFINTGTIDIASATGGSIYSAYGGRFSNTGQIDISASAHQYVFLLGVEYGGETSTLSNDGSFTVTGDDAEGFLIDGRDASFTNTGDITAVGTAADGWSLGIQYSMAYGNFSLTNSGTIQAVYAIQEMSNSEDAHTVITNAATGVIRGDILLDGGASQVINSGKIYGDLTMTVSDDAYTIKGGGSLKGAVYGGAGYDTLIGGKHIDILFGDDGVDPKDSDADDYLSGGKGADQLTGGGGADTLIGGGGADRLDAGLGKDLLVYQALTDSKVTAADHIFRFTATDRVDLSAMDADTTAKGDQAFHLVTALDGHAGEAAMLYDAASHTTALVLDVDGDGAADFKAVFDGDLHGFTGFVL